MIARLLKRNISAWQIGGYAIATLVGLTIVMTAVQFYTDLGSAIGLTPPADGGVSVVSPRNMVISKPVGLSSTLFGAPGFDQDEITDLKAQPWVKDVAPFQASDFTVYCSADIKGRELATAMFFESVPDRFIADDGIRGFEFDSLAPAVPIVLSKEYLALYNFGFAASGRMPVVSEDIISRIPLTVVLSGGGRYDTLPGRIVGFSSWLNTIAVPQSFMDWAHRHYGKGRQEPPSRLIVEVNDASDPAALDYMESNGYEVAGPRDDASRAAFMLKMVSGTVASVGGVITLLALFILVLSLFLLVQKSRRTISGLLMLGYSPAQVSRCYVTIVAGVNAAVLLLAAALSMGVARLWHPVLASLGGQPTAPFASLGVGLAVMLAVTAVNTAIIRRLVGKCF